MNFIKKNVQVFRKRAHKKALFRWISFSFFLFGFIGIWGLLEYSGTKPVNLFFFLLIAVVTPLLTFIINILVYLFSDREESFTLLLKKAYAYFGGIKEEISPLFLQKQITVNGIYYSLGSISALLLKVTFSDVLFGWTTSLNISADDVYSLTKSISIFWKPFFKEASPDLFIVKISEYFRTDKTFLLAHRDIDELKMIATWWKFLLMSIITYGIFPRLLYGFYLVVFFREPIKEDLGVLNRESIFTFSQDRLSSLFELSKEELYFYNSFLAKIIENDLSIEKNLIVKKQKQLWLKKWHELLFEEKSMTIEEIVQLLGEEKGNNKLLILLCEMTSFKPYYQLDEGDELEIKFNEDEAIIFIQKYASIAFDGANQIASYYEQYQKNLKALSGKNYKAWLGLAFLSAGAIALTGGLGIGLGVALAKILGVASVSAKATGIALMGSGIFLLGDDSQKIRLVVGSGALFSALNGEENFSKEYFASHETVKKDLLKLTTFYQFNFFSEDHLDFKQDFDYLLKDIAQKNSKLRKITERISSFIIESD